MEVVQQDINIKNKIYNILNFIMNENNKKIILQELKIIANKTSSKDKKETGFKKIQNIS